MIVRSGFARSCTIGLALLVLAGCVLVGSEWLDREYGPANPARYDTIVTKPGAVSWQKQVKPILEQRCVVCHSCYDAPCQLKLTAWEGVTRGANPAIVYDATRLLAADMTRLFDDAHSTSAWRDKGFFPVLNERTDTPEANRHGSVLWQLLALKREQPLPPAAVLPDTFDVSLDREQQCTRIENVAMFKARFPLWGMPFALPGLPENEWQTLDRWIADGAPFDAAPPLPETVRAEVIAWEAFLNGDALKAQLMSRYLYEHLFLFHLHFRDDTDHHFFRLVRSHTPPGQPIDIIATRRPFDDPETSRVYYRLQLSPETVVAKTHMPYALDNERRQRWQTWFLDADYPVNTLPAYDAKTASNPFIAFHDIPVASRYRFLLDEAETSVMAFIKGPVCRGQVALNVIDDRFWVLFVNPDLTESGESADFLASQRDHLQLPAEKSSDAPLMTWRHYAELQAKYLSAKASYLAAQSGTLQRAGLDAVWDGDGINANAALTVFRHYDNATVVKGLVGEEPKTVWLISYPVLERLHYLLVAGFDVYGNVGHLLATRLYMDFLRMESEQQFLMLLPEHERIRLRDYWYRDAPQVIKDYLYGEHFRLDRDFGLRYTTQQPKSELLARLQKRLSPVLDHSHDLSRIANRQLRETLGQLAAIRGNTLQWLPQSVFIRIHATDSSYLWVTLINNSAHSNISLPFAESRRRLPEEDTLTIVPGLLGAYPNAFWEVEMRDLPVLAKRIAALQSENDYRDLMTVFGVRRTQSRFWAFSDALHRDARQLAPVDYGLLDYNRLENR